MDLLTITSPPEIKKEEFSLLVHGFRPFFLLASGYGSIFLSVWLAIFFDAAPARPLSIPSSGTAMKWYSASPSRRFAVFFSRRPRPGATPGP